MNKTNLFRFIAFELEGIGQPKGDNDTIYGINKKYHPKEYERMAKAVEMDNPYIIQTAIDSIYEEMYHKSIAAKYFNDYYPLNINIFDMVFNDGNKNATLCWQRTVNCISNNGYSILEDGVWGSETATSLHILKQFPIITLNEIYSYERIKHYMSHSKNTWIHGLINRVIKLQIHIIKMNLT